VWGGTTNYLAPRQLPWTKPNVFNKMMLQVSGQSALSFKIGQIEMRYQILRSWTDLSLVVPAA
jgi:hypothetical protein